MTLHLLTLEETPPWNWTSDFGAAHRCVQHASTAGFRVLGLASSNFYGLISTRAPIRIPLSSWPYVIGFCGVVHSDCLRPHGGGRGAYTQAQVPDECLSGGVGFSCFFFFGGGGGGLGFRLQDFGVVQKVSEALRCNSSA